MRLKKTVAVALATALLATTAAVPAFAAGETNTMKYFYSTTESKYQTKTNEENAQDVGADNTTRKTTGTTDVKYVVMEAYTWSIPKEIDFGTNVGVGQTVTVTKNPTTEDSTHVKNEGSVVAVETNVIPNGTKLEITAKATYGGTNKDEDEGFEVKSAEGATLTYEVTVGDAKLTNGGVVLSVNAGTGKASKDLKFELTTQDNKTNTDASEIAGTYTGKITYTAEVKNQQPNT